jgi:hypothetical protein
METTDMIQSLEKHGYSAGDLKDFGHPDDKRLRPYENLIPAGMESFFNTQTGKTELRPLRPEEERLNPRMRALLASRKPFIYPPQLSGQTTNNIKTPDKIH